MDISRKIGIGITMIVPSFVLAGTVWSVVNSWILVWLSIAAVGAVYAAIITGRLGPVLEQVKCRVKKDPSCSGEKKDDNQA